MKNPKWYTDQEKIPNWLSVALTNHCEPYGKWNENKQNLGERMTTSIKRYSESYGWEDKVKERLFKPKFPESNGTYMEFLEDNK